jgi:hypothetical protein
MTDVHTVGALDRPAPSDAVIGGTTLPWLRLTREDTREERALLRGQAAQVPFLLAPELCDTDWAFHRLWDVRPSMDFAASTTATALVALAQRLDRVLVSQDPSFLDDDRFPPDGSAGIIILGQVWRKQLDEFLVTVVGLLGPVATLYRHVKVHGGEGGELSITSPEGRHRRVTRRFVLDGEGLPLLSDLSEARQSSGLTH